MDGTEFGRTDNLQQYVVATVSRTSTNMTHGVLNPKASFHCRLCKHFSPCNSLNLVQTHTHDRFQMGMLPKCITE